MPLDATGFAIETQTDRDLAVLRAARDGIARPGGWCQHRGTNGLAHCSEQWIRMQLGQEDPLLFVRRVIEPVLPCEAWSLTRFNDLAPSKAPVLALFDRAIARLETQRTST